jgi:hypothetical protein
MGMIVKIKKLSRMSVLLLIAFSVMVLSGCGKSGTPPPGATLTIEKIGDPIVSNLTITASATKTQNYRVSVADDAGLPLSGVSVDSIGQFTNGVNINFGGSIGSAPKTLASTMKTGDSGFAPFAISVPYFAQGVQLQAPLNQTAIGSATGGQLSGGTYSYTVTALDFAGETDAVTPYSAIVSAPTTSTVGSVALSWKAVAGATSYNVYGRISGSEGLMVSILCPCPDPVTFVDTGSLTPTGTPPPVTNTTGISLNSVKGTFFATAGSAISSQTTVDF